MADVNEIFVVVLFESADGLTLIENFSRIGLHETGKKAQQRSFARTVGAGQAHQRTGRSFKCKPREKKPLATLKFKCVGFQARGLGYLGHGFNLSIQLEVIRRTDFLKQNP